MVSGRGEGVKRAALLPLSRLDVLDDMCCCTYTYIYPVVLSLDAKNGWCGLGGPFDLSYYYTRLVAKSIQDGWN